MKIFDIRFFMGVFIIFLGLLGAITGILALLPPANNFIWAFIVLLVGTALIILGWKLVNNKPPTGSKIELDTLRRAKLVDKDRKD